MVNFLVFQLSTLFQGSVLILAWYPSLQRNAAVPWVWHGVDTVNSVLVQVQVLYDFKLYKFSGTDIAEEYVMQLKYAASFWFTVLTSLTPIWRYFNPSKKFGILNKTSAQHAYSRSIFTVLFLLNLRMGMVLCNFCMVVPLIDVTTWNCYSVTCNICQMVVFWAFTSVG
jgi:hypothetical protein